MKKFQIICVILVVLIISAIPVSVYANTTRQNEAYLQRKLNRSEERCADLEAQLELEKRAARPFPIENLSYLELVKEGGIFLYASGGTVANRIEARYLSDDALKAMLNGEELVQWKTHDGYWQNEVVIKAYQNTYFYAVRIREADEEGKVIGKLLDIDSDGREVVFDTSLLADWYLSELIANSTSQLFYVYGIKTKGVFYITNVKEYRIR